MAPFLVEDIWLCSLNIDVPRVDEATREQGQRELDNLKFLDGWVTIFRKLENNEVEMQRIKQLKTSINSLNKLNKQMEIFNIVKENDVLATFFSKTAPEKNFIEAIENISAVMESCSKQFIATFIHCKLQIGENLFFSISSVIY